MLDSCFEMFYKENEATYHPQKIRRADYVEGSTSALHAGRVIRLLINALFAGLGKRVRGGGRRGQAEGKPLILKTS